MPLTKLSLGELGKGHPGLGPGKSLTFFTVQALRYFNWYSLTLDDSTYSCVMILQTFASSRVRFRCQYSAPSALTKLSQSRKFLGSFRDCKSANFLGVPVRKSQTIRSKNPHISIQYWTTLSQNSPKSRLLKWSFCYNFEFVIICDLRPCLAQEPPEPQWPL